jgi:hypothetical protein
MRVTANGRTPDRAGNELCHCASGRASLERVAIFDQEVGMKSQIWARAYPFFVARLVSGSVENDSSCNSQVTICWIVIFITDIGIHEAVLRFLGRGNWQ